jgi:hypothetical protein
LIGSIPSLSGLSNLQTFDASQNRLSGVVPFLAGLVLLTDFRVNNNQLTGSIPPLAGLGALRFFRVENNRLTGAAPAVPSPFNGLAVGGSALCPNQLTPSPDAAWDAATPGATWSIGCAAPLPQQALQIAAPATLRKGGLATFTATVLPGTPVSVHPIVYSSLTPSVCTVNSESGEAIALPNPSSLACEIAANKAGDSTATAAEQQVASTTLSDVSGTCRLDVDGSGALEADVDGLLILRYLSGFRGESLISDLTLTGTRTTATLIEAFLAAQDFNVRDTPSGAASTSDGLILRRYLLSIIDSALVANTELATTDPSLARTRFANWCAQ